MKKIRYKLEAIIVKILFFIFRGLSIDKASNIAGCIARTIGPNLPVSNIAKNNLKHVFPNIKSNEIQEIIEKMWENLGRVAGELPHIYNLPKEEFFKRVKITGIEQIEEIKNKNLGAIFFSAHIGNWEVCPRIPVELGLPVSLIYRAANNKIVDDLISNERSKHNITILPKSNKTVRKMINTIKNGHALAMLVDQKMNDGIMVPFFGMDAPTTTSLAKLALNYKCPLIPAQVTRTNGVNFEVKIFPPIQYEETGIEEKDLYNIMLKINQMIENWIKEHPEQWFWLHRRWPKEKL